MVDIIYEITRLVSAMRITTLSAAIRILKEENPDSYITEGSIKEAIQRNQIVCIPIGRRKLVDVDKIQELLSKMYDPEYYSASGKRVK